MKQLPIHILYLSGLGDDYDSFRLRALRWWKYRNVTVELVPMKWATGTFEQKLARIDRAIDSAQGKRVVVVGESAGGSMAVHIAARRPDIYKVMTICGKNSHPETVGQRYYDHSPAFKASMDLLNDSAKQLNDDQRKKFVSIHPLYDGTVPVRDTVLAGCRQVWLPLVGHLFVIGCALTIFSPVIVRAARQKIK